MIKLEQNSLNNKKFKSNTFLSYFFPFFMILAQYPIFSTFTVGILIIMVYTILYYSTVSKKIYVHKYLLYLTLYITLMEIFDMLRGGFVRDGQINTIIMMYLWLFIISVSSSIIDMKKMYKVFSVIGMVSIGVIIYQSIFIYGFHQPMKPITILPIPSSQLEVWAAEMRPAAFFSEPQAYVSWIAPLLFLAIHYKHYLFSGLIIFSILLSGSSFGILFLAIYFIYIIFFFVKSFLQKFLILFVFLLISYIFFTVGIFDHAIEKIAKTDFEHQIRVAKGFLVYYEMNTIDKLFGIVGSLKSYILTHLNIFPWAKIYIIDHKEHLLNFVSSFSGFLVFYGIFANILLIHLFYKMFKTNYKQAKPIALLIIVSFFSMSFSYNSGFAYAFIIYFVMIKPRTNKDFIVFNLKKGRVYA